MSVLLRVARPRSRADRVRMLLVACSVAIAGAFVMATARIARLGFTNQLPYHTYSNYLAESGLRKGVAFAAVLLTVPAITLAAQALRVGTAAREQRLAAYRLAGATPGQVRRIAAAEAAMAGLAGGLLAGPVYLLLGAVFAALPRRARLLPPPTAADLMVWFWVVLAAVAAGGLAGWVVRRKVVDDPLGASRGSRTGPGPGWLVIAAVGVALLAACWWYWGPVWAIVLPGALIVAGAAAGERLVSWRGRRMSRSGDACDVLAGARLVADCRSTGRMAALLVLCGSVIGFSVAASRTDVADRHSAAFFLTGFGLAAAAALYGVVAAALALTIAAADEILRHRRQIAGLVALGAEPRHLRLALRRQLTAVAPWATAAGAVAGAVPSVTFGIDSRPELAFTGTAVAVLTGCVTWFGCLLAAWILGNQLNDAIDPENLRAD
jgi:hypothetical protein